MSFAESTSVPVERSRAEIETILRRYGADSFLSGWQDRKAMVQFRANKTADALRARFGSGGE